MEDNKKRYVKNPGYTPEEVIEMAVNDEGIEKDPRAREMAVLSVVYQLCDCKDMEG